MGSNNRPGAGYTPPKGQHTAAQGDIDERRTRIPPKVEWAIIGVVLVALLIVAIRFSSGGSILPPNNHLGAPVPVSQPLVIDQI